MAYSTPSLNYITGLLAQAQLRLQPGKHLSILELGAQEINADVTAIELLRCIKTLWPAFVGEADIIRQVPAVKASTVFKAAGIEYLAADLYDSEDTEIWDLNVCDVPGHLHNHFDMVTNLGTTEHVFNQGNAFKVVHDATKVGGLMAHQVPSLGYYNHGLYKYEPRFFWLLAIANGYEVVDWGVSAPELNYWIPPSAHIAGSDIWQNTPIPGMILHFTLRKTKDAPFVQPTDIDQRYVPGTFSEAARAGITVSLATVQNPFDGNIRYGAPFVLPEMVFPAFEQELVRLSAACAENGFAPEPVLLAAVISRAAAAELAKQPVVSAAALEKLVATAAQSAEAVPGVVDNKILPALGILGFGWQEAVRVYDIVLKSWRWFSDRTPATLYCRRPVDFATRACALKIILHDAKPGDTILHFTLDVNDKPVKGRNMSGPPGVLYWLSEALPKTNTDVLKLTFGCGKKNTGSRLSLSAIEFVTA